MHLQSHFFNIILALSQVTHCRPSLAKDTSADIRHLQGLTKVTRDWSGKRGDPGNKYFHESTFHAHYDGRFADSVLPYDERRSSLSQLVRTYLSTMHDIRAETWIMHGSLLGWWWNRHVMPWDSDIDVQVSETSIEYLANYYNMTVHHFDLPGPTGSEEQAGRNYLLEINPYYKNSSTSDILNVIDARWIDMSTGLFIDITALRYNREEEKAGNKGWMMCKDRHNYLEKDIFPLRESVFEDVPVKIPYAYAELLEEEYGKKALTTTEYEGHVFSQQNMEWMPKEGTSPPELRVEYKPLTTGPKGRRPSGRPSSERARTRIEADKVGEVNQAAESSVDS